MGEERMLNEVPNIQEITTLRRSFSTDTSGAVTRRVRGFLFWNYIPNSVSFRE